jgi:hypothetical protein
MIYQLHNGGTVAIDGVLAPPDLHSAARALAEENALLRAAVERLLAEANAVRMAASSASGWIAAGDDTFAVSLLGRIARGESLLP